MSLGVHRVFGWGGEWGDSGERSRLKGLLRAACCTHLDSPCPHIAVVGHWAHGASLSCKGLIQTGVLVSKVMGHTQLLPQSTDEAHRYMQEDDGLHPVSQIDLNMFYPRL